jgi:uncharacterized membrane protein YuzA (DUF378 family)
MRRIIGLAAVTAIVGFAAVWSVVTFIKSHAATHVQATETSAPIAPHDIMVKQGKSPPTEYFAHPF